MRDPNKLYFHDKVLGAIFDPIIPRSVTPNQITIFRMCMVPIVVLLLALKWYHVGIPFFLLVAFTDVLDGTLARYRKQVTEWGKVYDPLADKFLIGAVLVIIVFRYVNIFLAATLVTLDLATIIAGVVRVRRGNIPSANRWGKAKMFLQVTGVTLLLIGLASNIGLFLPFSTAIFALAIIFAIISLLSYGI